MTNHQDAADRGTDPFAGILERVARGPWLTPLLVAFVVAIGTWVRLRTVASVSSLDAMFLDGDPWYWARLAEEIAAGTRPVVDPLRNVPDLVANSWPPPLVALVPAGLSWLLPGDPRETLLWLPPLFAMAFVAPLAAWAAPFAPRAALVGAGLLGGLGDIYLRRTMPGAYDTDFLILSFGFCVAAVMSRCVDDRSLSPRSLAWVVGAGLTLRLFQWWYPKPLLALLFVAAFLAALLLARQGWRSVAAKVLLFAAVSGPGALLDAPGGSRYLLDRLLQQPGRGGLALPVSLTASIAELLPLAWNEWAPLTTGSVVTLLVAVVGVAVLTARRFRWMVPALPLLASGMAGLAGGRKNVIYLAPFLGLGLGYALAGLAHLPWKRWARHRTLVAALAVILVVPLAQTPRRWGRVVSMRVAHPMLARETVDAFRRIAQVTEPEAVLWSWWDVGYPLQYLARRATVTDGETLVGPKIGLTALAFMVDDEAVARRVIAYTTVTPTRAYLEEAGGLEAIRRAAMAWTGEPRGPVYVVIRSAMAADGYLRELGLTMAGAVAERPEDLQAARRQSCHTRGDGVTECPTLSLRLDKREVTSLRADAGYRRVVVVDRAAGTREVVRSDGGNGLTAQVIIARDGKVHLNVVSPVVEETVLNRLWSAPAGLEHFEPVLDEFPRVVVYRVR
jgi:dolichyl-diphosphooligosaccharide--protein glycosyltransferase